MIKKCGNLKFVLLTALCTTGITFSAYADDELLKETYLVAEKTEATYKVCKDFKDSSHELASSIDSKLEKNYKNVQKSYQTKIDLIVDCHDINQNVIDDIKQQASNEYQKSSMGQTMALALKVGPLTFINENDAYSRAKGCNVLSQIMKKSIEQFALEDKTCSALK